jgi:hypothetical protein
MPVFAQPVGLQLKAGVPFTGFDAFEYPFRYGVSVR